MARTTATYTAPANSVNPAVAGTEIDPSDFNTLLDDLESAITSSPYTSGLGSTDNALVRTDGTDTKKVQGTGVIVDDSNNINGVNSIAHLGRFTLVGSLTLANGANSDVVLPTSEMVRITGPTLAFNITGMTLGSSGRHVTLFNSTTQNMTITNDATSTADNRILTLTGADVTLTGQSIARLWYSDTDSRWILLGTQG